MPKLKINHRGSILIWTVLLGVVLTSVFFFFAMRLRANTATQRDTIAYQSAKAYLESYADYLQVHPVDPPPSLAGISGSLTKQADSIEGVLDSGETKTYTLSELGDVKVEWDKCGTPAENGNLDASPSATGLCASGASYDRYALVSASMPTLQFSIKSVDAPFHYKITPNSPLSAKLVDNFWHLNLRSDLEYGKKVEIQREFP